MSRPRILDSKIMLKIAKKLGKKDITIINRMVSRKASQLGISAEAALIVIAKENEVGTSTYQRNLDAAKQAEVRNALPFAFASIPHKPIGATQTKKVKGMGSRAIIKSAIEFLIQDEELRDRCEDLLLLSSNFDRAINQATLILEDRIRNKAQLIDKRLIGENLVNSAYKEELSKTVLQVASGDADDQRGFTQILRGFFPTFRNKTHHHIIKSFSREEALRVCGFIDVLLRVVDNSKKIK